MTLFGLKLVDLAMIAGYFAVVTTIGFWSARWVKTETDFFLGGRRFGFMTGETLSASGGRVTLS
jgi:Na+/proline symporter